MKKVLSCVVLVLVWAMLLVGCEATEAPKTSQRESLLDGEYAFFNISWTRDTDYDTETIRFGEDGSFSYYCGCGNPVNDSDLCEGYTYDHATKTITLNCIETTEEMITTIRLVKCDETSLHLDFNGEIRVFEKRG